MPFYAIVAPATDSSPTLQDLIGEWKGVGQVKRGSPRGAWIEKSSAYWDHKENNKQLVIEFADSKHLKSLQINSAITHKENLEVEASFSDDTKCTFSGKMDEKQAWVLENQSNKDHQVQRMTLRIVAAGKRLVVLLETKSKTSDRLAWLAEIGYTKKGSNFGKGAGQPVCIVTGGLGTTKVMYAGKTYYVCCKGCLDYFNDDPKGVVEEYLASLKEKKSEK